MTDSDETNALKAEIERLRAKVRPYSDAFAQKVIKSQVAEIDRLSNVARDAKFAKVDADQVIVTLTERIGYMASILAEAGYRSQPDGTWEKPMQHPTPDITSW